MVEFYLAFTNFFTFFGSGLCFFLTLIEFLRKDKTENSKSLFFLGIFFGLVQVKLGFLLNGELEKKPYLQFFFLPSIFAVGPIIFYIGRKITDFATKSKTNLKLHFVPFIVAILMDIYFFSLNKEEQILEISKTIYSNELNLLRVFFGIGILHILSYFFYLIFLFKKIILITEINYTKLVWLILYVPIFGILFLSFGLIIHNFHLFRIGASVLTITVMIVNLFYILYPKFFITLEAEIRKEKYDSTSLSEINVDEIKNNLIKLFEEEKIYLDEELRLNTVTAHLKISPNQLSRIINESYQMNFNEFVNSYRIKASEKLLLEDKKRSVISIAFEVGFNSKATFNSQFLKLKNMTPSEFRKKS